MVIVFDIVFLHMCVGEVEPFTSGGHIEGLSSTLVSTDGHNQILPP